MGAFTSFSCVLPHQGPEPQESSQTVQDLYATKKCGSSNGRFWFCLTMYIHSYQGSASGVFGGGDILSHRAHPK